MKLSEVCELIVDCPHTTAQDEGSGYALIRTPNIGAGYFTLDGVHRVSKSVYDARNMRAVPQPNDLILAREAPVGNVAIIPQGEQYCLGQRTVLIRPDDNKVNPHFLNYYLNSPKIRHDLTSGANGATVAHLNMPKIRGLEIELPPRPIQDRIAILLSNYDSLIANCRKQIALLEEAAQRLYREWFVKFRFPGHESVPIIDGLPQDWKICHLSDISEIIMGQSPASEFYNKDLIGLPFHQGVSSYGERFAINDTYTSAWTKEAPQNSILFSVRAPVGRLNISTEKIAIGRGLAAINAHNGNQSFLWYALSEIFYEDNIIGNGTIFASISSKELSNIEIILPTSIVLKQFSKIMAPYDSRILALDKLINYLSESRNLLLPRLMSGEIDVSEISEPVANCDRSQIVTSFGNEM